MNIVTETINLNTKSRFQMIDITSQISKIVKQSGITTGDCIIYCRHTTAAVTINENADPDVVHDILLTLEELIPQGHKDYRHIEGNSDAHLKSSLIGCSAQFLIENSQPALGTWQGIYFCEFDGPRNRNVTVQVRGQ